MDLSTRSVNDIQSSVRLSTNDRSRFAVDESLAASTSEFNPFSQMASRVMAAVGLVDRNPYTLTMYRLGLGGCMGRQLREGNVKNWLLLAQTLPLTHESRIVWSSDRPEIARMVVALHSWRSG